jgi:hypothetical protein
MVFMENTIVLTDSERLELNQRAARRSGRADDARRARLTLLLEANHTWAAIRDKLDCHDAFINRWSKRFREERLARLFSRHAGQEATTLTPALEARILQWTLKRTPPDGTTQLEHAQAGNAAPGQSHDGGASVGQADSSPSGWTATWPPTMRTLSRRPPTSLGCI